MKLKQSFRKELNDQFHFDFEPTIRYSSIAKAEEAFEKGKWGKSNLLVPARDHKRWYRLAALGTAKGHRSIIVAPFNPHYMYWFEYVHPYAKNVVLFQSKFPMFKRYDKPSPKTMSLVIFDPKRKRSRDKKKLYNEYADGKYVYYTIKLR